MKLWSDVIVIGAGMAGAAIAAELAEARNIIVLERENRPAYHSTGRSAATFAPSYGNHTIGKLTGASRDVFMAGLDRDLPLLRPRGALWLADDDSLESLKAAIAEIPDLEPIEPIEAREYCDRLKIETVRAAAIEEDVHDIDVDLLHQFYLKRLKAAGGGIVTDAEVIAIERGAATWNVRTANGVFCAPMIVNAAGAWGDRIARMVGVRPVGLVPKRRSAALIDPPAGIAFTSWPLISDAKERWYCRPMGAGLMISPADETPVEPCDAFAEETDIAVGINGFERFIDIEVNHVAHRWAGLRSFVADGSPVIGFDDQIAGFFWCVGQGGYGIQTAPAASKLGAALLLGRELPGSLTALGFDPATVSPERLDRADIQECQQLGMERGVAGGGDVTS